MEPFSIVIVGCGSYDITIVCGPKNMSLEKNVLISQKIKVPWLSLPFSI